MVLTAGQEEIFGSAYASAVYLSRVVNFPKDKKVYVIGQEGIEEELDAVGIQHVGGTVSLPSGGVLALPSNGGGGS